MGKPDIRPCPRLELRWRYAEDEEMEKSALGDMRYACDYGIVMPVSRNDVRSNIYDDDGEIVGTKNEVFYKFSTTMRGGSRPPGDTETPIRDGVHAMRDGEILGGLELWVESLFGELTRHPDSNTT